MPKTKKDGLWDYKIPPEMDGVDRALDFLLWAARHFPKRPVPITHIVRVAMSLKRLPKEESIDVETFRKGRMKRLKTKLMNSHKKGLVYHPGMGYRATVDDDDKVETVLERSGRRVRSAIAGLDKTQALVEPSKIRAEHLQDRFKSFTEANRRLNAPSIIGRLTPPAEDEKDEQSGRT